MVHELLDPLKADGKLDEKVKENFAFAFYLEVLNATVYSIPFHVHVHSLQLCKIFQFFSSVQNLTQEHKDVCLLVGLQR